MKALLTPPLDAANLTKLGKALGDDDSFVMLFELSKLQKPTSVRDLSKTFRLYPDETTEILERLVRLGLVAKKGRNFQILPHAALAFAVLQKHLATLMPASAQRVSSAGAAPDVMMVPMVADIAPMAIASTNNGTWVSYAQVMSASQANVKPTTVRTTGSVMGETVATRAKDEPACDTKSQSSVMTLGAR